MKPWLWVLAWLAAGAALWSGTSRQRLARDQGAQWLARWHRHVATVWRRRWKRAESKSRQRRSAAEFLLALADELTTGLPLEAAVVRAAEGLPCLPSTVRAASLGGDIPAALRHDATTHDLTVLVSLSAAWQVASGSGAGLAVAARNLGQAALERERARRELASEMAGPRATARVLALLPAIGLLLGSGFGGSPIGWLTGTALGWTVLTAGLALEVLGLVWVQWLIRRVERLL